MTIDENYRKEGALGIWRMLRNGWKADLARYLGFWPSLSLTGVILGIVAHSFVNPIKLKCLQPTIPREGVPVVRASTADCPETAVRSPAYTLHSEI